MRLQHARPTITALLSATRRWGHLPLLAVLCFLAPVGAMCLARGGAVAEARAADAHRHTWGERTCTDWSTPVNGCQHRMCKASCTYPDCGAIDPRPETRGCGGGGSFGGGGASGAYSATVWGPRPGGTGSDACPPHDWGDERCGPWHEIKPGCKIRHCTHRCNKCGTNGRDRMEENPDGCM